MPDPRKEAASLRNKSAAGYCQMNLWIMSTKNALFNRPSRYAPALHLCVFVLRHALMPAYASSRVGISPCSAMCRWLFHISANLLVYYLEDHMNHEVGAIYPVKGHLFLQKEHAPTECIETDPATSVLLRKPCGPGSATSFTGNAYVAAPCTCPGSYLCSSINVAKSPCVRDTSSWLLIQWCFCTWNVHFSLRSLLVLAEIS